MHALHKLHMRQFWQATAFGHYRFVADFQLDNLVALSSHSCSAQVTILFTDLKGTVWRHWVQLGMTHMPAR